MSTFPGQVPGLPTGDCFARAQQMLSVPELSGMPEVRAAASQSATAIALS